MVYFLSFNQILRNHLNQFKEENYGDFYLLLSVMNQICVNFGKWIKRSCVVLNICYFYPTHIRKSFEMHYTQYVYNKTMYNKRSNGN